MEGWEPMNWTKRQTQVYGVFMAALGFIIGLFTFALMLVIIAAQVV